MREFFSRALVLERKDLGEVDALVFLFTENYGKIVARAKSLRKIQSKLSSHLQPLNFIKVRLVKLAGYNDGFALVDCLSDDKFSSLETKKRYDLLPILSLINQTVEELEVDRKLWFFLEEIFSHYFDIKEINRTFLKIMGFNPEKAECFFCHQKKVVAFSFSDHIFLCSRHSLKVPSNKIISIK
ncbi:MAG: DNA repair protein RecO [Patescibacteria group bacterium]|nr:DNA repair protein RecO [Patescibacteria group bacterium]